MRKNIFLILGQNSFQFFLIVFQRGVASGINANDRFIQNTAAWLTTFFRAETGKPIVRRISSKRLRSLYGMVSS